VQLGVQTRARPSEAGQAPGPRRPAPEVPSSQMHGRRPTVAAVWTLPTKPVDVAGVRVFHFPKVCVEEPELVGQPLQPLPPEDEPPAEVLEEAGWLLEAEQLGVPTVWKAGWSAARFRRWQQARLEPCRAIPSVSAGGPGSGPSVCPGVARLAGPEVPVSPSAGRAVPRRVIRDDRAWRRDLAVGVGVGGPTGWQWGPTGLGALLPLPGRNEQVRPSVLGGGGDGPGRTSVAAGSTQAVVAGGIGGPVWFGSGLGAPGWPPGPVEVSQHRGDGGLDDPEWSGWRLSLSQ